MTASAPITVGMPVYNGERYLVEALDSLLAQTYTDFHLIISDNASTDATPDIAGDYAGKDKRITAVRHSDNMGGAANWSWVAKQAHSPYFKWAAADDVCAPAMLERCHEALEERDDAVLAYPGTVMIDENGVPKNVCRHSVHTLHPDPAVRVRQVALRFYHANAVHGVIRTPALQQTSLIKPWFSSDFTTLCELALRGTFVEVPELLFYRRRTPTSAGLGSLNRRQLQDWFLPGAKVSRIPPAWRVSWNNQKSISTAPLSSSDRLRCHIYYREARAELMAARGLNLMRGLAGRPRRTGTDLEASLPYGWRPHAALLEPFSAAGDTLSSDGESVSEEQPALDRAEDAGQPK